MTPHKHSINGYRSGKYRDCPDCRSLHNANSARYRERKKSGEVEASKAERQARWDRALALLEDGASYWEVSASTRCEYKTLKRKYPGFEGNAIEFRSIMAGIISNQQLLKLHREIWQEVAA